MPCNNVFYISKITLVLSLFLFKQDCVVLNYGNDPETMNCRTPNIKMEMHDYHWARFVQNSEEEASETLKLSFGFLIGDVQSLRHWSDNNSATLDYFEDPVYEAFGADPERYNGSILIIKVGYVKCT